jgi:hypothetical protein
VIPSAGPPTLSVSRTGNGSGAVTSSPDGIDCPTDCEQVYDPGTPVTLTASPNVATSSFGGWAGGGCGVDPVCVVTMDAAKSVAATFTLVPHSLTVSKAGSGAGTVFSSPGGISCGADCAQDYSHGRIVVLTPAAEAGSVFTGWSGACSGVGLCVVTVDAAKSVTATFETLRPVTLSVVGNGTAGISPSGTSCGPGCQLYPQGTEVTVTAGWSSATTVFVGWTLNSTFVGFANPLTFNVGGPTAVTATFAPKPDFDD